MIGFINMFFDHCGYGQYDYLVTESKVNKFSTLHKLGVKRLQLFECICKNSGKGCTLNRMLISYYR
jgi:hypothetical protein